MNHLILPAIAETEIELTFKLRLKEAVYHELTVHEASDASSEIRKAEQGDNAPSQVLGPMGVSHFGSLEMVLEPQMMIKTISPRTDSPEAIPKFSSVLSCQ